MDIWDYQILAAAFQAVSNCFMSQRIGALATRYEQKLAQEKDDKVRLRGQAGIHQKYHIDLHLGI